jgi:hypothetical protein
VKAGRDMTTRDGDAVVVLMGCVSSEKRQKEKV